MKNSDVKALQEIITKMGLQDDPLVDKIMCIDTNELQNVYEYYKNLEGKYFKFIHGNSAKYIHFLNSRFSLNVYYKKEEVKTKVSRFSFSYSSNYFRSDKELDYTLCSPTFLNRYKGYKEITKEEYDKALDALNNFKMDVLADILRNG